uniref:Uncharacterized protein n=1 Tax=Arion vulgaris TaxID=1028688 RepID=A0A0B6ZWN0_9EUPU
MTQGKDTRHLNSNQERQQHNKFTILGIEVGDVLVDIIQEKEHKIDHRSAI